MKRLKVFFWELARHDLAWLLLALIVFAIISLIGGIASHDWPAPSEINHPVNATPVG